MRQFRNIFFKTRSLFYMLVFIVFYNEFLIYWLSYLNYPSISQSYNGIRLLFVADPQLIGDNDEPWYLKAIAKWDSDRYVQKTFHVASYYTNPDFIIFLGDLFDEGVKSSDQQFNSYYKRFTKIFKIKNQTLPKMIFLSGDNDIGGEYNDRTKKLEKRFEDYFGSLIQFKWHEYISFLKLDLDRSSGTYTKMKRDYIRKLIKNNSLELSYMFILNHATIYGGNNDETNDLITDTNAALVIKGDDHRFSITKYSTLSNKAERLNIDLSKTYTLNLQEMKLNKNAFYELSVPTCSYRMGVPQMGYVSMTVNRNGKAYISILWSPSRFKCIYFYLLFLITILMIKCCCKVK